MCVNNVPNDDKIYEKNEWDGDKFLRWRFCFWDSRQDVKYSGLQRSRFSPKSKVLAAEQVWHSHSKTMQSLSKY